MIYRGGKLVFEVQKNVRETIDGISQKVQKNIGAIYKGTQLVWLTIYNAIKSCYGSGQWLSDKLWIDDTWKN